MVFHQVNPSRPFTASCGGLGWWWPRQPKQLGGGMKAVAGAARDRRARSPDLYSVSVLDDRGHPSL